MPQFPRYALAIPAVLLFATFCVMAFGGGGEQKPREFKVYPIGYVRKVDNRTTIVLDKKYEPGLLRMEKQSDIWVLWWFDRNDTPEKRSILQVHPKATPTILDRRDRHAFAVPAEPDRHDSLQDHRGEG